eukprot:748715-Hanusia_phi.AAC.3
MGSLKTGGSFKTISHTMIEASMVSARERYHKLSRSLCTAEDLRSQQHHEIFEIPKSDIPARLGFAGGMERSSPSKGITFINTEPGALASPSCASACALPLSSMDDSYLDDS